MQRGHVGISLILATLGALGRADASEPFPTRAERILSPGRSAASDDSAEATSLNPANLAFLPAWEARWTGVRCPDTRKVGCGHSFDAATPLLFGLSTGLRVDYVIPPQGDDGVGFPYNGYEYAWVSWALAYKFNEKWAVGASVQRSYSSNAYTDGLFGLTAAASFRPSTHFAFATILHDLNGPSQRALPPNGYPVLDRSFVFAMAFRPLGTRALEAGLEAKYLDGTDQVMPRATLGIDIPGVGRARGDVEIAHLPNDQRRGVVGTAGLEIGFGGITAGGGALFGSGLGTSQSFGQYATLSIAGYMNPGVPRPQRAVSLRIEHTPGTRGHAALLRKLWHLAEEKEIAAVTLILRAEPSSSLAHAEELADAIRVLRSRGKKVLCSWEDAVANALYTCASADRVVINPAGGLRYAGLKTTHFYLAKLLDNLGVKAEFVRIGAHKSAPEQFMNEKASDVARADHEDMLRQYEAVFNRNLSIYRKLPESRIREWTQKGPFVASEAREAGFVDGYAFDDELERVTQELVGSKVKYEEYKDETPAPSSFGVRGGVAVLFVDGDIIDGRSARIPIIDMRLVGSYTIAETVKKLREDSSIKSVVLRIESPGGAAMAADVMWRELTLLAKEKPLIVSMGSVAASGGYYIAAPGREIYALPLTITGSIGIFYGKADVSALLKKVGVGIEVDKTTPRADAESFFRGFTDEERKELEHKIHQFYDVFLDRVAQGRHMTKEQVDADGQGRVWTGQQALDNHLVDRMGGLRHALAAAREAAGLSDDAPVGEYPEVTETLFEKALGLVGIKAGSFMTIEGLPVQVRDVARAIAPMAVYSGDVPMARMELVPMESQPSSEP